MISARKIFQTLNQPMEMFGTRPSCQSQLQPFHAVCGLDWQANRKPLINASNIFDIDGPGDFTTFELQQPDGNLDSGWFVQNSLYYYTKLSTSVNRKVRQGPPPEHRSSSFFSNCYMLIANCILVGSFNCLPNFRGCPSECLKARYAEMEVSFSTADWVVSLGAGVEIPRMGEKLGIFLHHETSDMPTRHRQICQSSFSRRIVDDHRISLKLRDAWDILYATRITRIHDTLMQLYPRKVFIENLVKHAEQGVWSWALFQEMPFGAKEHLSNPCW